MVKKITKYLKFAVCCTLILSLIAPSYAALSASDGSAFVTKAEFDSALADFNARLTTFEAGINSKIDSQVSSYLDRNGIWNGQNQVLDPSGGSNHKWHVNIDDMATLRDAQQCLWLVTQYGAPKAGTDVWGPEAPYKVEPIENQVQWIENAAEYQFNERYDQILIGNVSKSGLLYLQLKQDKYMETNANFPTFDDLAGYGLTTQGRDRVQVGFRLTDGFSDTLALFRLIRSLGTVNSSGAKTVSATSVLVDFQQDTTPWGYFSTCTYPQTGKRVYTFGPLDWKTGRLDIYLFFVNKGDKVFYGLEGTMKKTVLRALCCRGAVDAITVMEAKVY